MPLKRTTHFTIVTIIRVKKVRANKQQDDACIIQISVNLISKLSTRTDSSIMPSLYSPLSSKQCQLLFKLIPKGFIRMRV